MKQALRGSEDSEILNASFVERLNLALRQGSAYLGRRTLGQARWKRCLGDHLELLRCHYNFVRPHQALKCGREVRTPAMQARLTNERLTFKEIFYSAMHNLMLRNVMRVFGGSLLLVMMEDKMTDAPAVASQSFHFYL